MRTKTYWLAIAVIALVVAVLACDGEETGPPPTEPPEQPAATEVPAEEAQPTGTPVPPTNTPEPTATPEPVYSEPVTLLEVDGTGEAVTDNFELPECFKAVFHWDVLPSSYGSASLIAHLHKAGEEGYVSLVNEMQMDVPAEGMSGQAFQPLAGGEYYFATENTDEPWSIRVECQDNTAPVAEGMDVQGEGPSVTANYQLSECTKSVFSWSVEPSSIGSASLIVHLHRVGTERYDSLVNEMEMDLTEAMTGEALQAVDDGLYFLVVENTDELWSVRWECRD